MKRILCMMLCTVILFSASGCLRNEKNEVSFYYCRNDYIYGEENGVIAAEKRDASGHTADLDYLLSLYLLGPMDETLFAPLPADTRLISADIQENTVFISLSELPASMPEAHVTLAFGCLTLTCLEITGANQVTITSADRSVTMDRGSLLLFDNVTATSTTEDTQ